MYYDPACTKSRRGWEKRSAGFHAFRRFRITQLRKQHVMEVLLRIWVETSTKGITDKYTVETLKRDVAYRKAAAQQLASVSTCFGAAIAGCTNYTQNVRN
jgi:hypothetical protein